MLSITLDFLECFHRLVGFRARIDTCRFRSFDFRACRNSVPGLGLKGSMKKFQDPGKGPRIFSRKGV